MYSTGRYSQKECDNLFLDNMTIIVNQQNVFIRPLCHVIIFHFYLAVRIGGTTYVVHK